MSSLQGVSPLNTESSEDPAKCLNEPSRFCKRIVSTKWRIPRRYIVAIMCCLAFVLRSWMDANISMIFYHLFLLDEEEKNIHIPHLVNWTLSEVDQLLYPYHCLPAVAQMPSAILSMAFSPHKVMAVSMGFLVLFHILIPWAVSSAALFIVVLLQSAAASPLDTACIGMLREWTPYKEKTALIVIAFSGQFALHKIVPVSIYLSENISPSSIYYFAGLAGFIWCLMWCCLIGNSPVDDPLITESEMLYLEATIPSQNKEKVSVKSVPWRSILSSHPIQALLLAYTNFFFSTYSMRYLLMFKMDFYGSVIPLQAMEWITTCDNFLFIPVLAFLVDFLINKRKIGLTLMRKIMCSSGFLLQISLLVMEYIVPQSAGPVFFMLALLMQSLSTLGFLPNILDLSTRYACVIVGLAQTLHHVLTFSLYLLLNYLGSHDDYDVNALWMISYISTITFGSVAAVVFARFGSGEEQELRVQTSSTQRRGNDARYYPRNSSVEDEILSSDNL